MIPLGSSLDLAYALVMSHQRALQEQAARDRMAALFRSARTARRRWRLMLLIGRLRCRVARWWPA